MKPITPKQYAAALYDAVHETAPADHEKVLDNFVQVLVASGAINLYDQIEAEYKSLELAAEGIQEVRVTTARDVKVDSQLVADLNRIIGRKVEITHDVDERILGGVVIRAGDTLIDGSLATSIRRLAQEMES